MNGPFKWTRPKRLVTARKPRFKRCLLDEEGSRVKAITFIQCPEVDSIHLEKYVFMYRFAMLAATKVVEGWTSWTNVF